MGQSLLNMRWLLRSGIVCGRVCSCCGPQTKEAVPQLGALLWRQASNVLTAQPRSSRDPEKPDSQRWMDGIRESNELLPLGWFCTVH